MNKEIENYITEQVSEKHQEAYRKLFEVISKNIPKEFELRIQYGMPSFVVPYSIYPAGYHCDQQELPFISLGGQKHHVGLYHMGIYMNPELLAWFTNEYQKLNIGKLDMGKSCIRLKNPSKFPYELIGQLMTKMSVEDYLQQYQKALNV